MWLRYTRIMSVFPIETRRVNNLNILLLFCVSIEPFLFNLVRNMPAVKDPIVFPAVTSALYALDLGAMFAILGGFSLTLADEERKLIPKALIRKYRIEGGTTIICGLIFCISALPIFYTTTLGNAEPIRYYLWAVPLLLLQVARTLERRVAGQGESATEID
jgi:hypothetical protein